MTETEITARIQCRWMDLCIYVKEIHTQFLLHMYLVTDPKNECVQTEKFINVLAVLCILYDPFLKFCLKAFSKNYYIYISLSFIHKVLTWKKLHWTLTYTVLFKSESVKTHWFTVKNHCFECYNRSPRKQFLWIKETFLWYTVKEKISLNWRKFCWFKNIFFNTNKSISLDQRNFFWIDKTLFNSKKFFLQQYTKEMFLWFKETFFSVSLNRSSR